MSQLPCSDSMQLLTCGSTTHVQIKVAAAANAHAWALQFFLLRH